MNDKTKIITPLFDPKMHDELTEACRNSIPEQIMKDWGGGFKKGEMVIFSTPGPTPFVPRDPDIHRGSLYPLIVHPVTQRKSAMVQAEAREAGIGVKIPMEMSDDEMKERVLGISKYVVFPDSFRRSRPFDGQQYRRPIRMVERRLSLAVKEYIYSILPKVRYVMKHRQNHPMDPVLMEVGGYSDKVKRQDMNPNRPALPLVGECLTGRLKPTNVPMTRGEGDPLNLHRKYQVGKLRPEHKLENVIPDSTLIMYVLPGTTKEKMIEQMAPETRKMYDEGKIVLRDAPTYSNIDSHSEFEEKKGGMNNE
ncbi:hypothetical protein [Burkholderia phage FLC6]|nr:hypothetical protein [Burkholderia phage FLC6]